MRSVFIALSLVIAMIGTLCCDAAASQSSCCTGFRQAGSCHSPSDQLSCASMACCQKKAPDVGAPLANGDGFWDAGLSAQALSQPWVLTLYRDPRNDTWKSLHHVADQSKRYLALRVLLN